MKLQWTDRLNKHTATTDKYYVTIVQQSIDGKYVAVIEVFEGYGYKVYCVIVGDTLEDAKEKAEERIGGQ